MLFEEYQAKFDGLDVLVNNAGVAGPAALVQDIEIDEWNSTINVDLNGQFTVTRQAVPLIKAAGGGSIINMSSNAGLSGCPMRSPYVAAKEQSVDADRIRQTYQRQSSMRQFTDAEDVAAMAFFLSSNAGAKISGQAIGIDGHTEGLASWLDD